MYSDASLRLHLQTMYYYNTLDMMNSVKANLLCSLCLEFTVQSNKLQSTCAKKILINKNKGQV